MTGSPVDAGEGPNLPVVEWEGRAQDCVALISEKSGEECN